ncbi:MAG: TonB family protein [Myxococcaceae bacterium]
MRWLLVVCCTVSSCVFAHELDGGVDDDDLLDGGISHVVVPPSIRSAVEAEWPPSAPRVEAHVHLELQIDAQGRVSEVRVLESAGDAFDESALAAVQQYQFNPATEDGVPVRSFVTYTYAFHPPAVADGGMPVPSTMLLSTTVSASRPLTASSAFSVRDRDFALRPIASVQDILRITPGLVTVQHSGGGKANQYFLRGFDADHGTDVAINIDGVPVNLVSHGHGQGYADTNFLIPEAVERVEITKGPSFAQQGDFATAGAINLITRDRFEHSSFGIGVGGSPGHGQPGLRAVLIGSPKFDSWRGAFAAELGQDNGPFESPNAFNKYKLFNRLTFDLGSNSTLSVMHLGYGADWKGSGQLPERAVEQGLVSRFGSLDSTEGGNTLRHQLVATWRLRPSEQSELKALAYLGTYRFNLFSNFTGYLADAVNGDQLEQVDRRTFFGAKAQYRIVKALGVFRFDTTLGLDTRTDDVRNELWHDSARQRIDQRGAHQVSETFGGGFVSEDVSAFGWLRINGAVRADAIFFSVEDLKGGPGGVGSAFQVSPKLNVVVSPVQTETVQWDLFANYGHGFHSNDVRGAFATPKVTPLTRAIGGEIGTRARLFDRWDLAATGWRMSLGNETVWSGDEGTTSVSGATRRYGLELETRFELFKWLAADLDVTFTKAEFVGGGVVPLAPLQTWSGGLSARHELGPGIARAGLRFYGLGDRPADEQGALVATGFTQVDLHVGWRHRLFDVAIDLENLFNAANRSAQFATTSRLAGEPAIGSPVPAGFSCGSRGLLAPSADGSFQGCTDVAFTPAYPFTARLTATVFLD